MGKKLKELINDPRYSKEDRRDFQILLDRYTDCDKWAKRAIDNTGILLTSHPGNRAFLKSSVESHKKLGYWLAVSYDNYFDPDRPDVTFNDIMPNRDVMDNVDTFIMPHYQTWGGVLYPYFWLVKFGLQLMSGFEYTLCCNGDCIIETPENFNLLIEMLGDHDILPCGWEDNGGTSICHTAGFFGRTEKLVDIINHIQQHFIPLENYEKYEFGNCEARFARAILDLNIDVIKPPENPWNEQLHRVGGTWYDLIGFRHIHGEYAYAYKYHDIPPEVKYYDKRHLSPVEYKLIENYHNTKNMKYLEEWWKK